MPAGVPDQHRPLAQVAAQDADLVVRAGRAGRQAERVQLLGPLAVEHVALPSRGPLGPAGIDQPDLDPARTQPLGRPIEVAGERRELPHRLGVAVGRDRHEVGRGAHIDAGGVGAQVRQRARRGWPRRAWAGTAPGHQRISLTGIRRGEEGDGDDTRTLSHGICCRSPGIASPGPPDHARDRVPTTPLRSRAFMPHHAPPAYPTGAALTLRRPFSFPISGGPRLPLLGMTTLHFQLGAVLGQSPDLSS